MSEQTATTTNNNDKASAGSATPAPAPTPGNMPSRLAANPSGSRRRPQRRGAGNSQGRPQRPTAGNSPHRPRNQQQVREVTAERRAFVESLEPGKEFPEAKVVRFVEKSGSIIVELADKQTALLRAGSLGVSGPQAYTESLRVGLAAGNDVFVPVVVQSTSLNESEASVLVALAESERRAVLQDQLGGFQPGDVFTGAPEDSRVGVIFHAPGAKGLLHRSQSTRSEREKLIAAASASATVLGVDWEKGRLALTTLQPHQVKALYNIAEDVKRDGSKVVNAAIIRRGPQQRGFKSGDVMQLKVAGFVFEQQVTESMAEQIAPTQRTLSFEVTKFDFLRGSIEGRRAEPKPKKSGRVHGSAESAAPAKGKKKGK